MLEQLQKNIGILISKYETQKERADRLEVELEKLRKAYTDAEGKNKELEDKVDKLSLRSAFSPLEEGNDDARIKIDRLIREIDAALALLK